MCSCIDCPLELSENKTRIDERPIDISQLAAYWLLSTIWSSVRVVCVRTLCDWKTVCDSNNKTNVCCCSAFVSLAYYCRFHVLKSRRIDSTYIISTCPGATWTTRFTWHLFLNSFIVGKLHRTRSHNEIDEICTRIREVYVWISNDWLFDGNWHFHHMK